MAGSTTGGTAPIPISVDDAIAIIKEGTKVEGGILNILKNRALGVFSAIQSPAGFIEGDEFWIRKNSLLLGADRASTLSNNFYTNVDHDLLKIPIKNEYWIRFTIDPQTLLSLGKTYTGQSLSDQYQALIQEGWQTSFAAKFDCEAIDLYNKAPDTDTFPNNPEVASVNHLSIKALATSKDPINEILGVLNRLNLKLSDKESQISQFIVGTNQSEYSAIGQPFLINTLDNYILRFGGNDSAAISGIKANSDSKSLFGLNFTKHPFFNQFVNARAADLNNIDRTKTIFDASSTFDFSGLAGLVVHNQAGIIIYKFVFSDINRDFHTGNIVVVARVAWGKSLLRNGLLIKIKDSKEDQWKYADNVNGLAAFFAKPANAIVAADGADLKAPLLTAIKAYTGDADAIDLATATITSAAPDTAAAVTAPTSATAKIVIPIKSGTKADAPTELNISFFYKNA